MFKCLNAPPIYLFVVYLIPSAKKRMSVHFLMVNHREKCKTFNTKNLYRIDQWNIGHKWILFPRTFWRNRTMVKRVFVVKTPSLFGSVYFNKRIFILERFLHPFFLLLWYVSEGSFVVVVVGCIIQDNGIWYNFMQKKRKSFRWYSFSFRFVLCFFRQSIVQWVFNRVLLSIDFIFIFRKFMWKGRKRILNDCMKCIGFFIFFFLYFSFIFVRF